MATVSFDGANIPQSVIAEVTRGIVTSELSLFDEIAMPYDGTTTLNGTIPGLSASTTLAGPRATGYAPGEAVAQRQAGMSNTTFACTRFHDEFRLTAESGIDLGAIGLEHVTEFLTQARAGANSQLDLLGVARLSSTSLNRAYDASAVHGEWDDYTAGRPMLDMDDAIKTYGLRGGIGVFGLEIMSVLKGSPDFMARVANFTAAGILSDDEFKTALASALGLSQVFILDKHYNSADAGLTVTLAQLGGRVAWIGRKENLRIVRPRITSGAHPQNFSYTEPSNNPPVVDFGHMRWADIVRAHQDTGVIFTHIFQ